METEALLTVSSYRIKSPTAVRKQEVYLRGTGDCDINPTYMRTIAKSHLTLVSLSVRWTYAHLSLEYLKIYFKASWNSMTTTTNNKGATISKYLKAMEIEEPQFEPWLPNSLCSTVSPATTVRKWVTALSLGLFKGQDSGVNWRKGIRHISFRVIFLVGAKY